MSQNDARTSVFQYWDHSLPPDVSRLMVSWKRVEPEFCYEYFDDERARELIRYHFGRRVLSAYDCCAISAMKADIFRYCALLTRGGIYVDADSEYVGGLRECYTSGRRGVLIQRRTKLQGIVIANGFMAFASAGDSLLQITLDTAIANVERRASNDVWSVTGPGIMTSLFASDNPCHAAQFEGFRIVPLRFLDGKVFVFRDDLHYKKTLGHWPVAQKRRSIFVPSKQGDVER